MSHRTIGINPFSGNETDFIAFLQMLKTSFFSKIPEMFKPYDVKTDFTRSLDIFQIDPASYSRSYTFRQNRLSEIDEAIDSLQKNIMKPSTKIQSFYQPSETRTAQERLCGIMTTLMTENSTRIFQSKTHLEKLCLDFRSIDSFDDLDELLHFFCNVNQQMEIITSLTGGAVEHSKSLDAQVQQFLITVFMDKLIGVHLVFVREKIDAVVKQFGEASMIYSSAQQQFQREFGVSVGAYCDGGSRLSEKLSEIEEDFQAELRQVSLGYCSPSPLLGGAPVTPARPNGSPATHLFVSPQGFRPPPPRGPPPPRPPVPLGGGGGGGGGGSFGGFVHQSQLKRDRLVREAHAEDGLRRRLKKDAYDTARAGLPTCPRQLRFEDVEAIVRENARVHSRSMSSRTTLDRVSSRPAIAALSDVSSVESQILDRIRKLESENASLRRGSSPSRGRETSRESHRAQSLDRITSGSSRPASRPQDDIQVCEEYFDNGSCSYGDNCKYAHLRRRRERSRSRSKSPSRSGNRRSNSPHPSYARSGGGKGGSGDRVAGGGGGRAQRRESASR